MIEFKILRKLKNQPYSAYKNINSVTLLQIKQMYEIYEKYYENTNYELFQQDFLQKTGVFLVFAPKTNAIVGFSTIVERDFIIDGRARHAFFSGDTIIEKEYWGSRALQRCMIRYIVTTKLKHPTQPIYWMLISKGFKTYLLLTNNYITYYPNIENKNEHLKDMIQAYCEQYYKEYYNKETGLLNFGDDYQPLKESVAPIHNVMRNKNKNIEFFESCNPTWIQGTELPCIGEMSWKDLYQTMLSFSKKGASKGRVTQLYSKLNIVTDNVNKRVA